MPTTSSCPSDVQVRMLALGDAPPAELESLVTHLEGCPTCLHKVKALAPSDTLIEALTRATTVNDGPDEPVLSGLIDRLSKLTQAPGQPLQFSCPNCGKGLKCKPELAGRKVKCPKCGQAAPVPGARNQESGVRGQETGVNEGRTQPPADRPEPNVMPETTLPPRDASQQQTAAASASQASSTRSEFVSGEEEEAWDFLAPPQQPDEIGRLGPYRILKVLGAGGMGVVFRAEDPRLERIVAIKAMLPALAASPSAKKRFLREAKTAASIKHDHIVTIYQVDEDRGAPYLAMEFLHGEPLDARLKRGEPGASAPALPLAEALRIGEQIAEGLAAAHDEGLIHRDIKPANIWLETRGQGAGIRGQETGVRSQEEEAPPDKRPTDRSAVSRTSPARVKILDFGLARSTSDQAGLTQSGAIVGTPSYMAPEQAQGATVDHRCDLFSLGCVLYVMTTGQLPFKGNDTLTVLMAIASSDPPSPSEVNPEIPEFLSSLVLRLLSKKADDRPQSAREVAASLRALAAELEDETTALPSTPRRTGKLAAAKTMPRPAVSGSRRRLVMAGGLLAMLAIIAAGVVFFLQTPDGTLRVEINDPQIEVSVKGTSVVLKQAGNDHITLQPGEKVLHVKRGTFEFDTNQLILKSGQTVVVKIDLLPGKVQAVHEGKVIGETALAPPEDLDRAAAKWALDAFKGGGRIRIKVGANIRELKAGDVLPAGPFTLVAVMAANWDRIQQDDLVRFRDLPDLKQFALFEPSDTDFRFLNRNITSLDTVGLKIKASGLGDLARLDKLEDLSLWQAAVDDAGLAPLKNLPRLKVLFFPETRVTDAGLAHVGATKTIEHLTLPEGVKGSGLKYLANLPLRILAWAPQEIDDTAGEHLARLKNLEVLALNGPFSDRHLLPLASLKSLRSFNLRGKNTVTAAGLRRLKADLPNLKNIEADPAIMKELPTAK